MSRLVRTSIALALASVVFAKPETSGGAAAAVDKNTGGAPSTTETPVGNAVVNNEAGEGATVAPSASGAVEPAPGTNDTAGDQAAAEHSWIGVDFGREVLQDIVHPLEAAFRSEFPRLTKLLEAVREKGVVPSKVRVTSSQDGFFRGGRRHPFGSHEHDLDAFSAPQMEAMLNEPKLAVELG